MKLTLKKLQRNLFNLLPWWLMGVSFRISTKTFFCLKKFRRFQVGKNSYVDPSVQIIGWRNVRIGNNTTISEDSWLNVNFRDEGEIRIVIGNNCHIGRRNFFSSGPLIIIKDYGFTGLDCHFLGAGHNIDTPMMPFIKSGLSTGGVIEIGANCWLTTGVTVQKNVKIGCGTVIGAKSMVIGDIPPFSIAIGNPCKVIKRFDFKNNQWVGIENWSDELESFIPDEKYYLEGLVKGYKDINPSLISGSRRFGWI